MLRFVSSLLVMLLGAAAPASAKRVRSPLRLRGRQAPDDDGGTDRALEAAERPRARARQLRRKWPGMVELVMDTRTMQLPGTWALEWVPLHRGVPHAMMYEAPPVPVLEHDAAGWVTRVRRVVSFAEPGIRLRVGDTSPAGWRTLEVAVPTRPPTILQLDVDALGSLLGGQVEVRLRIDAN